MNSTKLIGKRKPGSRNSSQDDESLASKRQKNENDLELLKLKLKDKKYPQTERVMSKEDIGKVPSEKPIAPPLP
jgi:hypothetical protein